MSHRFSFGIRYKMLSLVAIFVTTFSLFVWFSFTIFERLRINGDLYKDVIESKDLLADVLPPPQDLLIPHMIMYQSMYDRNSPELLNKHIEELEAFRKDFDDRLAYWQKNLKDTELRGLMVDRGAELANKFLDSLEKEFIPALKAKKFDQAASLLEQRLTPIYEERNKIITEVVQKTTKRSEAIEKQVDGEIQLKTKLLMGLALTGMLIAIFSSLFIASKFIGPIFKAISLTKDIRSGVVSNRLNITQGDELGDLGHSLDTMAESLHRREQEAQIISKGDLRQNFTLFSERDSLGLALTEMTSNFARVLREMTQMVNDIVGGSLEISSSSQALAQNAIKEAATVADTAAIMQKTAEEIDRNTTSARKSEAIATKLAADTHQSVEAVLKAVNFIKGISEKISIIGEIARKTELLAINAAVEAARAGEQGRGFAVVAAEISKLAEKSQEAASEISQFSSNGLTMGENAGRLLNDLVPEIITTHDLIKNIAQSSESQNEQVKKVNNALQSFDSSIQSNAAASEQLSATVETFNHHAKTLEKVMAYFKIRSADDHVKEGHTATHQPLPSEEKNPQIFDRAA